ncbi:natterin-1-like [Anolis sagrei]|uniref:natterin-1-like n=1 Tax=Anolis sagrei TaxID=38937 RepID=UPI0035221751
MPGSLQIGERGGKDSREGSNLLFGDFLPPFAKMHPLFCAIFVSLIMNELSGSGNGPLMTAAHFHGTTVKWVQFEGSVPSGAVSFWNSYHHSRRWEYPCRVSNCAAGYYSPSRGPFCYYPYGDRERGISPFWVLVNEYDFESLKWEWDSYGGVPRNSISTCPGVELYVGRNRYGLGKVDPANTAFFLGYAGKEYWYKEYEVLTINKDYRSQEITNVRYKKEQGTYSSHDITLLTTKVNNHHCKSVQKTTALSKTVSFEHRWDIGISLSETVSCSITVGIPKVIGTSWGFSSEKTYSWNKGFTQSESVTYTETVEVNIPPNHSCEVAMEGTIMKANIPFTASVTRYYHNGERRSATVSGVSKNVVVAQVHTEIKRCQPIPDAEPCLS